MSGEPAGCETTRLEAVARERIRSRPSCIAVGWCTLALVALVAAACSGGGDSQAPEAATTATTTTTTETEPAFVETETVVPDCGNMVPFDEGEQLSLCFVAFGDPTPDGSGGDGLIEGVRIVILEDNPGGASVGDEPDRWWGSVAASQSDLYWGSHRLYLRHGQQVQATPELITAAAVPSVVTGTDGTARAVIERHARYQFCAVHPDDGGLIAGCSSFDSGNPEYGRRRPPENAFHHDVDEWGLISFNIFSDPHRSVFVYFSFGRAFFDVDVDSGRYGRFLAGDTHPAGTGKITLAGFTARDYRGYAEIYLPLGAEDYRAVAVVKDEDVGLFWDAVRGGWFEQFDFESPQTWAPAELLRTGADGTATAHLPAGDYLFCWVHSDRIVDCTHEDVTAGQDRILEGWGVENVGYLTERTEQQSVDLLEAIAACGTSHAPLHCATYEQYDQARQHYKETGEYPEDW